MAFDQPTRNRLQKFVGDSRALLTEEFTRQLQHEYGLNPTTGEVADLNKLTRLDDGRRQTARMLRETLEHYLATNPGSDRRATIERIVREQAFTVLNRLCALRMAEARGLLIESIGQGYQSKGFQLYARLAGTALGETGDAYRCYLFSLFDEFAVDLAVLFDRFGPSGRLFPREAALLPLLEQINHPDIDALWAEDETIGWIYQYFNSKDERKKMRDESAAPRNSRELAVRNQFFTPRYVVEFLTDNTLGRIWYEMTQGQTSLKDKCRYLVRRPNEVFLKEGKQPPESESPLAPSGRGAGGEGQSQADLLKQPVYIPHRPLKDPRDIKMLDPACGSMHFGLYAFDLFERIYQEAWQLDEIGDRLARDYGWESDSARSAIPDSVRLRPGAMVKCFASGQEMRPEDAVVVLMRYDGKSIAGRPLIYHPSQVESRRQAISLTLPLVEFDYAQAMRDHWFDASTGCIFLELAGCFEFETRPSPTREEAYADFLRDVPRLIIEHNIHGIDIDPRAVQIAGLSLWLRAQKSWQAQGVKPQARPQIRRSNIACAEPMPGEAAFLEEFIAQHLSGDPERQFLAGLVRKVFDSMKLAGEAGSLLKIEEEIADEVAKAKRQWLDRPALKQRMLFAAAPKVEQKELDLTRGITDASFWDDAEKLLYDALRAYSQQAEQSGGYQRRLFADDAARGFAFIDLCRKRFDVVLMNPPFGKCAEQSEGYFRECYPSNWKELYAAFFERTLGLLCAFGRVACISSSQFLYTKQMKDLRAQVMQSNAVALFIELGHGVLDDAAVETALTVFAPETEVSTRPTLYLDLSNTTLSEKSASLLNAMNNASAFQRFALQSFARLETAPFCFHSSPRLLALWNKPERLDPNVGRVATGNHTFEDWRFLRLRWEVTPTGIGNHWLGYEKGGEYQPFISPTPLVVNWLKDGAELRVINRERNGTEAQVMQSSSLWFRSGICYSHVSSVAFGPRVLPQGHIFSSESISIFPRDAGATRRVLALLCSTIAQDFIWCYGRYRKIENRAVSNLPFGIDFVASLPPRLDELAKAAIDCVGGIEQLNETSPFFATAIACHFGPSGLIGTIDRLRDALQKHCDEIDALSVKSFFPDQSPPVLKASTRSSLVDVYARRTFDTPTDAGNGVLGQAVGCAFGRWDIRFGTGETVASKLPDPFAPLPACSPGMLQNEKGLPLSQEDQARLQAAGSWQYPIDIPWNGLLVDDPGHLLDIEARVQQVLKIIWPDRCEPIEHEACEMLGVKTLREYFRKPALFFADHLKRYSKSRRQAPIYWPLATASGSYTLWVYYHRLTDQTLYTAVNDFVEPKLDQVSKAATRLRQKTGRTSTDEKELEQLTDLEQELKSFRDELLRLAQFWKPNLNDGVQITAAPLWKLFRLSAWQKKLKQTWQELEAGDYDWAHLAHSIWPDRVAEKCKTDKSLAIAHNLEHLYIELPKPAKKRATKKKKVEAEIEDEETDE